MDDQTLQQHINAILAHLDEQQTQESPDTAPYEQQPHRVIDVYVMEPPDEEPPTVESTIAASQESQDNEKPATPPASQQEPHSTSPRWWILALVAVCLFAIGIGSSVSLLQLFTPSATITIVTASQHLTTTSTVQLVITGTADPAKHQLAGRLLPAITMSQQKTVPTTGTAHQQAQAAHGAVTFYNAAPSVQTVNTGTLLTGTDGVQIVTDQDATIPAAAMPTEGQVTVLAHAALTGRAGNISAGDVYGQCCRLDVFAANGAFHGGQDARTYQTVTAQDITSVVTTIKTSLEQSVQAALHTQVQPSETLFTPLACTQQVTPDHAVGAEATQMSVTVNETCAGTVYPTQALSTLATQLATQDATKRFGTGYTTTGVQTSITHSSTNAHGITELQLTAVSLWAYPFTQEQQQVITAMIAGMNKDKATTTLLHLTGIQSVSITLKNSTTLPTDAQQIHLLFLQV